MAAKSAFLDAVIRQGGLAIARGIVLAIDAKKAKKFRDSGAVLLVTCPQCGLSVKALPFAFGFRTTICGNEMNNCKTLVKNALGAPSLKNAEISCAPLKKAAGLKYDEWRKADRKGA